MNVKRAVIAFLISALVPGVIATLVALWDSPSLEVGMRAFWFVVWYAFSAPLVLVVGFPTLLLALKLRYGPIFLPPIVGGVAGVLVAKVMYSQGMNMQGLLLFTACGLATALVAALIYFKPLSRSQDPAHRPDSLSSP
ncbi:MAG: hypothetical protein ACREO8_08680 [Luteimonas sp.]